MAHPALQSGKWLVHWIKRRSAEAIRLLLAFCILLATSGCAATLLTGTEYETVAEKAEEEAGSACPVSAGLRVARRQHLLMALPAPTAPVQVGRIRSAADHAAPGHRLPNGLRAPLRC